MLIPTFEDAINLVNTNPELYRKTEKSLDGGLILHTFDYVNGADKKNIIGLGLEMRGISFVENQSTKSFKRYLSLRKFYNLNERSDTSIENLKNKTITNITVKEDGSLISFIALTNGNVMAKTRNGMNSVSTHLSNEFIKRNKLSKSIYNMIEKGYLPFFEITGLENIVVILYPETRLSLLQVRKDNGFYLNRNEIKALCIEVGFPLEYLVPEVPAKSLEELASDAKTAINTEGWVVMFNQKEMVKIKTDWYLEEKRKLYSDNVKWVDLLIAILNDKIDDDDLAELPSYRVSFIKSMQAKISILFENYVDEFIKDFAEVKKNCFVNNEDSSALRVAMKLLGTDKVLLKELAKKEFLKKYQKEQSARMLFMKTKD